MHVPVCRRKCLYCSFYSVGERFAGDWGRFVDAILSEFDSRMDEMKDWEEVTIYIGGGTPSLMPPEEFKRLMDGLRVKVQRLWVCKQSLRVCNPQAFNELRVTNPRRLNITEVTIEVNPDDVTEDLAKAWNEAGVNRISMGVQSLVDSELKAIGRRHDAATAVKANEILSKFFDNISFDLIFGLPSQTLDSLNTTLVGLMAMHPKHISAYSLMYEERSVLTRLRDAGKIEETDEDVTVKMFELVNKVLSSNGFHRYEISNYSLPGFESRHNSSYWYGVPYIGLGPSAHSYNGENVRRWNIADINEYLEIIEDGGEYFDSETLNKDELIEERIMTGLRTSEGISIRDFERDFGVIAKDILMRKAEPQKRAGNLLEKDGFLRLTDKGVMVSDEIMLQLF